MKTEAGPSALPILPSRTLTSKVSRSPSSLAEVSSTTASLTLEPSLENTDTVAFGGSLAKLPVCQIATMSGVTMWPTLRTGRLVKSVALGRTPSSTSCLLSSLAPRAFNTIKACEYCRAVGTPIVFWAGAVMALGAGGAVSVWAKARPVVRAGARIRAARRLHLCCAFIMTGPSFPGRSQPRLV